MGWVDKTSNVYWTGDGLYWDGSKWDQSDTDTKLYTTGTWDEGYRPTKIRITGTVNVAVSINLYDGSWNVLATGTPAASVELDITFAGNDMYGLYLYYYSYVTKIEFYEEDKWSHNFIGVNNTCISKINGVSLASIKSVCGVE